MDVLLLDDAAIPWPGIRDKWWLRDEVVNGSSVCDVKVLLDGSLEI